MKRLFLILCIVGVLGCATAQPKSEFPVTDQPQKAKQLTETEKDIGGFLLFDLPMILLSIH